MPRIEHWENLPTNVRQHLIDRMRDRAISLADLNQLRLWIESQPEVPEGDWYKDFGSFKICGHGSYPKTFLLLAKLLRESPYNRQVPPPRPTQPNGAAPSLISFHSSVDNLDTATIIYGLPRCPPAEVI